MARRAGTWSAANATRPQRPSASLGVTASLTDRLVIKFVTYSELSVAFARLEELERVHILRVVARTPSLNAAAEVLGIDQATLYRKRKKYEGDGN